MTIANKTVEPWGRFVQVRADIEKNAAPVSEGGGGAAEKFWAWSEEHTKAFE